MSRIRSAANMIADVRARTNMENSEFVEDDEILEYLNQGLAELHGRITANEGQPHFRSSTVIPVTAGTSLYALPSDFWKLQRLVATIDGRTLDCEPFMEGERASLLNATIYGYSGYCSGPMYRIQGGFVEILPSTRTFSATMFYTYAPPRLVVGGAPSTEDGFGGYEMAAIYDACAVVAQKEETDPSIFLAQKDRILKHIDSQVAMRDASHPERVTDVVGGLYDWWGNGGFGGGSF